MAFTSPPRSHAWDDGMEVEGGVRSVPVYADGAGFDAHQ